MHRPLFTLLILLAPATSEAQVAHLIRGLDFFFLPDTLFMEAGDSVKFQTQGMHNMVEVDEAAWLMNMAIPNGGFQTIIGQDSTFVMDDPGTYHFVCGPHASQGMKGVLIVAPGGSTGISGTAIGPAWAFPVPASQMLFILLGTGNGTVRLRDDRGSLLLTGTYQATPIAQVPVAHLPPGHYMLEVDDANGPRRSAVLIAP